MQGPQSGKRSRANGGTSSKPIAVRRALEAPALTPPLPLRCRRRSRAVRRSSSKAFDPAVPAADLPGGRHRLRRSVAGSRGDQRGRGRLWTDLSVSSAGAEGLDAVPAGVVGDVWRRRQRDRSPTRTPGRRDLADRALPARAGAATNLRGAIFSYNHSRPNVESVRCARTARRHAVGLLGAITGLTESRFRARQGPLSDGFRPWRPDVAGDPLDRRHDDLLRSDAPVIAVQDGQIVQSGTRRSSATRLVARRLRHTTSTPAGKFARLYPVAQPHDPTRTRRTGAASPPSERGRPARQAPGRRPVRAFARRRPWRSRAVAERRPASRLDRGRRRPRAPRSRQRRRRPRPRALRAPPARTGRPARRTARVPRRAERRSTCTTSAPACR